MHIAQANPCYGSNNKHGYYPMSLQRLISWRELGSSKRSIERLLHGHGSFITRLSCESVLDEHTGCVNTLSWNDNGSLLASGSDDTKVVIWDYAQRRSRHIIDTGHLRNIFGVCFVGGTDDQVIASGSMDCQVRIHYSPYSTGSTKAYYCHEGRVKDVKSVNSCPNIFWTGAEDGVVRQFDLRDLPSPNGDYTSAFNSTSDILRPSGIIIRIGSRNISPRFSTRNLRIMAMSIHPLDPTKIAIACGDQFVRVFDRRMLRVENSYSEESSTDQRRTSDNSNFEPRTKPVSMYTPPHMNGDQEKYFAGCHGTSVQYSGTGEELIVSYHNDHVYLFNTKGRKNEVKVYDTNLFGRRFNISETCPMDQITLYHLKGNESYRKKEFTSAVEFYSMGIYAIEQEILKLQQSNKSVENARHLHNTLRVNRSAAYLNRKWRGDNYMAMLDCSEVLKINPMLKKAQYRLVQSLRSLRRKSQMKTEAKLFQANFPADAKKMVKFLKPERRGRRRRRTSSSRNSSDDESGDPSDEEFKEGSIHGSCSDSDEQDDSDEQMTERVEFEDQELISTNVAGRYIGYCNIQTEIKEAKFFGSDDAYIISGSDDGRAFMWEKETGRLVNAVVADEDILNCVQGHPFDPCIATSGIENVVRLWTPTEDNTLGKNEYLEKDSRRKSDLKKYAESNQSDMDEDPTLRFMRPLDPNIVRLLMQRSEGDDSEQIPQCTQS